MDNYIKTISLTYNSTNVKPSTILSYFFRMIGTYIQENVIDVSQNTHFPENSCLNIFLISKPKDLEFINQNCQNVKNKILVTNNKDLESNEISYYHLKTLKNKIKFLKDMVSFALESIENEDNRKEIKASLDLLIEAYIENRIAEKMLIRKFHFDDSPLYEDFIDSTNKAIKTINYDFDNKNLFHANYAAIRLAYESCAVSYRNNKPMNWKRSQLLSLTDMLLKQIPSAENLYLLKGSILTDLFDKKNEEVDCLNAALYINPNHPSALLKLANYMSNHARLSRKAYHYYIEACGSCSLPYKAFYCRGNYVRTAYEGINERDGCLRSYNMIPKILENKLWNAENDPNFQILLSPREIQFLYFAYLSMGLYMCYAHDDYIEDILTIFFCFQNTSNLYNYYIDQNRFIQTVFGTDRSSEINKLIKKQLQPQINEKKIENIGEQIRPYLEKEDIFSKKIVKITTRY